MYGAPAVLPARRPPVGYWITALLAVIGVAGVIAAVAGFSSFGNRISSFQRVPVASRQTVTFTRPGGYLIYLEGPGFSGLSTTGPISVSIRDASSGQPVQIETSGFASEKYSAGGHSGQSGGAFTIITPGRYVVTAGTPRNPAMTDVALGPGIGAALVLPILAIVFAPLFLISAVLTGALTALVRRRRARQLAYAGLPGGPAVPYGPGVPYGGQAPWNPGAGAPGGYAPPPYGQYPGPAPGGPQYPGAGPGSPQYPTWQSRR